MTLVDYLVARGGPAPRHGLAYDYVLAGDGLYLVTENSLLGVRVPVARCAVRGLPPLYSACELKHGRLPLELWERIVALGRAFAVYDREVLCAVTYDADAGYHLVVPRQLVRRDNVYYRPPANVVLEIHSHHRYSACFSATDDADEQRLSLYGVIGRLDTERPEVSLRVGAYGYCLPVPWETVFEGGRGVFRDNPFDPVEEEQSDDDVPN